jgi:hypothetical protein
MAMRPVARCPTAVAQLVAISAPLVLNTSTETTPVSCGASSCVSAAIAIFCVPVQTLVALNR